jgi:chromosome segregation ATPase
MTDKRTRAELLTENFHLSNIAGNLAKENSLLRAQVDSGGVATLQATIVTLEARVAELEEALREKELAYSHLASDSESYEQEARDLGERVEQLEQASDPNEICDHVHEFLRSEHLVPAALDAPLRLAPHSYRVGLHEAIQKVVNQ